MDSSDTSRGVVGLASRVVIRTRYLAIVSSSSRGISGDSRIRTNLFAEIALLALTVLGSIPIKAGGKDLPPSENDLQPQLYLPRPPGACDSTEGWVPEAWLAKG